MTTRPNSIPCIAPCVGRARLLPMREWKRLKKAERTFIVPFYRCDTCKTKIVSDFDVERLSAETKGVIDFRKSSS